MRRLLTAVALVAGALSLATSASVSAQAADDHRQRGLGIRLVDVPVATAEDPRALVYIIDHLAPGTVIERRVEVANHTGDAARVSVYPGAAEIRHGEFAGVEGRTPNELSTWTSVSPETLRLAARAKQFVDVRIKVPSDAAPGERYSAVWAQTTIPASAPGGVSQVSRVGVRVYLSVGPGGEPASDFKIESFTAERNTDGVALVQAKVHNTGGRALDLAGSLRLSDGPGGLSAGPFPITLGTTLGVGQSEPVTVVLDSQLPNGPWKAHIQLSSGLLKRTAQATLTFPDAPGRGETVKPDAEGVNPLLWAALATVLVLAGLAAFVLWRRQGGRRRRVAATSNDHVAGAART